MRPRESHSPPAARMGMRGRRRIDAADAALKRGDKATAKELMRLAQTTELDASGLASAAHAVSAGDACSKTRSTISQFSSWVTLCTSSLAI